MTEPTKADQIVNALAKRPSTYDDLSRQNNSYRYKRRFSRFELQKNEVKPLKRLSRAQNRTLRPRVQFRARR